MKIDIQMYSKLLIALEIPPDLILNTYAKQFLEETESKEHSFASPRGQSGSGYQVTN